MMSRWISLVPPPKVITSDERWKRSRRPASTEPSESPVSPALGPTTSISER